MFRQLLAVVLSCATLWTTSLYAQDCGTELTPENQRAMAALDQRWQEHQDHGTPVRAGASMNMVPVQLHIIRTSAGTGGVDPDDLEAALDRVNEAYVPAHIQFYQIGAINYVDNDTYYDFIDSDETALRTAHEVGNVLNVFVANSVGNGSVSYCGYAHFPGGPDFTILDASCALNGSTFEHEIGHYFGLYHTHETYFGSELVDGSNCVTTGDLICDTPADPTLSSVTDPAGCTYFGAATDGNGDVYNPQVSNIMSYASKECRTVFTDDQLARMDLVNTTSRTYLTASPSLTSDFIAENNEDCADGATVDFSDVSYGGATGWTWNFGDGNTSNQQKTLSYLCFQRTV